MIVKVSDEQAGCITEYSEITGRAVDECFREAIDDWLLTVAATISQNEIMNVLAIRVREANG